MKRYLIINNKTLTTEGTELKGTSRNMWTVEQKVTYAPYQITLSNYISKYGSFTYFKRNSLLSTPSIK